MKVMTIAKRRKELRREIEIAKAHLLGGFKQKPGKAKNYSSMASGAFTRLIETAPAEKLRALDQFARLIFDKKNIVRRILKYLNITLTSIKLLK